MLSNPRCEAGSWNERNCFAVASHNLQQRIFAGVVNIADLIVDMTAQKAITQHSHI